MKIGIVFLFFISICSICNGQNTNYKIIKIKKVNSHYIIYATNSGRTVKIVSKKDEVSSCIRIKKNMSYQLMLSEIQPLGGSEIDCITFEKKTVICKEPEIDLFIATNLKGLCLMEKEGQISYSKFN